MDLSTVLSVVQTLISAIQALDQFKPIFSISDCKRQLADLQNTVDAVKSVLEDAAAKQDALNSQEKNYIRELKDAVYDADDVIDEFVTLSKRKQLNEATDKLSHKVRSFLSRFKLITHNLSTKVKEVNSKLDAIATKSSKFSFKVENKPLRFRKEETSCFVSAADKIIGREEDVEKIVGMLLESDVDSSPDVSFLAIVGMGGLGKTALAQLVYNDPRVADAFPLKSWTCIADQNQEQWNLTELLEKVLTDLQPIGNKHTLTSLQQIQREISNQLGGKKYLLILDDVWTEVYHRWQELEEHLKVGRRGSRIVVTTRSNKTAQMVGGGRVHKLRGLSGEDAWSLFEKMAFLPEQRETPNEDLVEIGKEVVKKCTDVPLAIRVVGSLLRGQSKAKWRSFKDKGLPEVGESDDTMNHILKLSYHQLGFSLKSCFAYCAMFPKDFVIDKQMLINLWMALGYISAKSVGEEYFGMLLQRCFFQDVREDEDGEIESFKIHDLLHDIAEQVAGEEICRLNSDTHNVSKSVRHISLLYDYNITKEIFDVSHLRAFLQPGRKLSTNQAQVVRGIGNWTCLRTLDLSYFDVKILPESIGKLLHLRFLDLSFNLELRVLPKFITKLLNLQTLDLNNCTGLTELPKDVSKLVNLQTLNLSGCLSLEELPEDVSKLVNLSTLDTYCSGLSHMPSSIGTLTGLHTLGLFVVGRGSSSGKHCFHGLEDLRALNNLRGNLGINIRVDKNGKYVKEEHGGGAYLRNKEHLKSIYIEFENGEQCGSIVYEKALLEEMQPHPNLRLLSLKGYHGVSLPTWPRGDSSTSYDLPNLVRLLIFDCRELQYLPLQAGKLPHLKELRLSGLPNLEYVVNANPEDTGLDEVTSFFPSLEILYLRNLPKLNGWWPRSASAMPNENLICVSSPCLSQLNKLIVDDCPRMAIIPFCPCVEDLKVTDSIRNLRLEAMIHVPWEYQSLLQLTSKPRMLSITDLEWLKSMPTEYFQSLATIVIRNEKKVESLAEVRELFQTCFLSSLRFVVIYSNPRLRNVVGWLEHLSNLVYLEIHNCVNLVSGVPWEHLPHSLRCLKLMRFEELEELPEKMQCCTSLQSLVIWDWPMLDFLPNWVPKLTSLEKLELRWCSQRLKERCEKPKGEDWPLIQHIPLICVRAKVIVEERASGDDSWVNDFDTVYF